MFMQRYGEMNYERVIGGRIGLMCWSFTDGRFSIFPHPAMKYVHASISLLVVAGCLGASIWLRFSTAAILVFGDLEQTRALAIVFASFSLLGVTVLVLGFRRFQVVDAWDMSDLRARGVDRLRVVYRSARGHSVCWHIEAMSGAIPCQRSFNRASRSTMNGLAKLASEMLDLPSPELGSVLPLV